MEKILFDTDIGSDIDDAVCLAYLLKQPECNLLGITTVSGQPVRRAQLASALCKAAGKEVPIYPGVEQPLFTAPKQPLAPQADRLGNWAHNTAFPNGEAIEFLRRTIRENPGEVTLLAVGPMTNIGLLFSIDPEIPLLLKQLVLMCGVFTNRIPGVGPTEWNAICDPYAAALVYNAPVKRSVSVGLDVTCQVKMDRSEVEQRFRSPIMQPVLDFAGVWFQKAERITFHDPLAGALVFREDLCNLEQGCVEVELESSRLQGLTHWTPGAQGKHHVALEVDSPAFFSHYFDIVNA